MIALRMVKSIRMVVCLVGMAFGSQAAAGTLSMSTPVSATHPSNTTVVLSAARISYDCPSGTTGGRSASFRLELWATTTPYSGNSISGYRTAWYQFEPLPCNHGITNASSGTISYTAPPANATHFTMLLTEYDGAQYVIADYRNLSSTGGGNNGNLVDMACSNNVVTLKFWDDEAQDGDIVTVTLGNETLASNFNMNQCGGPSEPFSGPCVFNRTLPANSAVPFRVLAHNVGTGGANANSARLKVIGQCTPEAQSWLLTTGQSAQITINTGSGGGGGATTHALNVMRYGSGRVTSSPSGIDCGSTCQASFSNGTTVTLTASANSGYRFDGWSGACSGSSSTCTVTMNQARSVTASFVSTPPASHTLNVSRTGSGTVLSIPSGINCGSTCQASFSNGTSVTLTATPAVGSRFDGWGGACSGSANTCTVTMSQARSVSARFGGDTPHHTLTITRTGSGTVTSSPSGINCGSSCQGTFAQGAQITLTATPAAGWRFVRWGSGCTGSTGNTCRIAISQNRTASVVFEATGGGGGGANHTLTLTRYGSGTVTSSPAGIQCGNSCQGTFERGTQVALTAVPAPGWQFHKWGSGCTGSTGNVCSITVSQNRTATAYFQESGGGTRTASLFFDHVDGPTSKTIVRNSGTPVTFAWRTQNLPAATTCKIRRLPNHDYNMAVSPATQGTATNGSIHAWATGSRMFYLWCSDGTTSPNITLTINAQVSNHTLTVQKSGSGTGTVVSNPSGINCGSTCSASFTANSIVVLTAFPTGGNTLFDGWGGACSGRGRAPTCTVTMDAAKTVGAYFHNLGGEGVQAISAGGGHSCALTTRGAVLCWGSNSYGVVGDGTTGERHTPVQVNNGYGMRAISAGKGHTCSLTDYGAVFCWGGNSLGQSGSGSMSTVIRTPVGVDGLGTGVQAISAGGGHTCALTTGGAVKCWGGNGYGQLGDGTMTERMTPVQVTGLGTGVQAISAGGWHTCVLTVGGAVKCWGDNTFGQLGDRTTTNRAAPVQVYGLGSGVKAISAGSSHTCALTTGGAVKCWGYNNFGRLGDGTTTDRLSPVEVSGLADGVRAISAGGAHTCAVTWGVGAVKCWGYNTYGELGDGTTVNRHTPVQVSGLVGGIFDIDAGDYHTCALTMMGGIKCWGMGGAVGDGTWTNRLTPVSTIGLPDGTCGPGPYSYANTNDYTISDFSTVESPIAVCQTGNVSRYPIRVNVRVLHSYKGDLVVDVVSPSGTYWRIHNRTGGAADNVIGTWTLTAPSSGTVRANGVWRLRVQDMNTGDTGYIDSWSIQF